MEDYFDDKPLKAEAAWSHLTISLPGEHRFSRQPSDWLDPSSAWLGDVDAVVLPITSEPYDWDLDENPEDQFPLYVPIPPPVWNVPPARPVADYAIVPIEQAVLIPIDEILPRQSDAEANWIDEGLPAETTEAAFFTYIIRGEPVRRRNHVVSSVLLLLLAVIVLFVFAWIAQK